MKIRNKNNQKIELSKNIGCAISGGKNKYKDDSIKKCKLKYKKECYMEELPAEIKMILLQRIVQFQGSIVILYFWKNSYIFVLRTANGIYVNEEFINLGNGVTTKMLN